MKDGGSNQCAAKTKAGKPCGSDRWRLVLLSRESEQGSGTGTDRRDQKKRLPRQTPTNFLPLTLPSPSDHGYAGGLA
jgi:hypothetical protein